MFLGRDVADDIKARVRWYKDDWVQGFNCYLRILAPALCIFSTSLIPSLAFGERLASGTDGVLTGTQIIAATAICGVIQAVVGGQPLVIYGVGAPIVIVYVFLHDFATQNGLPYLAWAAWVCVWAAGFTMLFALLGTCKWIIKITRFSMELFEILIALIFVQEGFMGIYNEFKPQNDIENEGTDDSNEYYWRLVNGNITIVLAFGFLLTALLLQQARTWVYFKSFIRNFIADYGVSIMVVVWTGVSYCYSGTPEDVPRRQDLPNTWETNNWTVTRQMLDMGAVSIVLACVPGLIIALLMYFDHNMPCMLCQRKEFNLKKPTAYHWDFFLLGIMTLICGLLGLPPASAAIPMAPMHVRSLATLRKQIINKKLKKVQSEAIASWQLTADSRKPSAQDVLKQLEKKYSSREGQRLEPAVIAAIKLSSMENLDSCKRGDSAKNTAFDFCTHLAPYVPVEVKEQRVSNLLQSLMMGACLGATPVIRQVPIAVLWGYFIYMGVESLPGNQFWERLLLLFTDRKRRNRLLMKPHAAFLETVPFKVIALFTVMQFVIMMAVWTLITFAGVGGIAFPIPIMLLIPLRLFLFPKIMKASHLDELDAVDYEEATPVPEAAEDHEDHDTGHDDREVLDAEIRHHQIRRRVSRDSIRHRRTRIAEEDAQRVPQQQDVGSSSSSSVPPPPFRPRNPRAQYKAGPSNLTLAGIRRDEGDGYEDSANYLLRTKLAAAVRQSLDSTDSVPQPAAPTRPRLSSLFDASRKDQARGGDVELASQTAQAQAAPSGVQRPSRADKGKAIATEEIDAASSTLDDIPDVVIVSDPDTSSDEEDEPTAKRES